MASNHTLDNYTHIKHYLVGGIPTPLKNISQLESLFLIYGKIKNAPNHQPVIIYIHNSIKPPFCSPGPGSPYGFMHLLWVLTPGTHRTIGIK